MNIVDLVKKYEKNRDFYLLKKYNEALLRNEFLDIFFQILGWDIRNDKNKPTNEREVLLEEPVREGVLSYYKKPDYTFRLYSERKFFVEAKKPSVDIKNSNEIAFKIRSYGWTANLKISLVSNFEYLIIYDCTIKPEKEDNFDKALIARYHFTEYSEKLDELKKLLGYQSVYKGIFDKYWDKIVYPISKISVDELFLKQINSWRKRLGDQLIAYNNNISEDLLNDSVQGYINSLIFLRVCEDRNLEEYQDLLKYSRYKNFSKLLEKFKVADSKYNSGLFDYELSKEIIENVGSVFWDIIEELYYPNCSYSFSVLSSNILGEIYEIFLSEKLIKDGNKSKLVKKPEYLDRDIITTPTYIINEILKETLLPKIINKDYEEIIKLNIADIACGSGAFLLEAYQLLVDTVIDISSQKDKSKLIQTDINTFKLPFTMKIEILLNCIYGVDKDFNAVQSTKFGLLLKILEEEKRDFIKSKNPSLPLLDKNILCGNSLVELKDVQNKNENIKRNINPFEYDFKFDIIVSNPPYMKTESMKKITLIELQIYKSRYKSAYKQFDKYYLFIERGISLLKKDGMLGYIVPSKFTKIGAGKKIREILSKNKYVKKIISFGANQIFKNRTTYTCILILSKNNNEKLTYYEVDKLEEWQLREYYKDNYNQIKSKNISENNWILLPKKLENIYKKIWICSKKLEGIIGGENIFNGIQTSANDVYIISKYRNLGPFITFEKDNKAWKIEKELTKPYFETSKGFDNLYTYRLINPNALLIYPYKKIKNKIKIINIKELEKKYPGTFRYLSYYKDRLTKRDIQPKPSTVHEWYRYGRHQSLDKFDNFDTKIIVGVLSIGDKYSIDKFGTYISSGGTAGYCAITIPPNCKYSIYYIQAILNSKYVEWISILIGDIFRGGYFAHGTAVLKKLPIKIIDFDDKKQLDLYNNIADTQKLLIELNSNIDKFKNNKREKIYYQKIFDKNKKKLDNNLIELYEFNKEEDNLIPLINKIYEAD